MSESAFQQWLAISGYCAARSFDRLPYLIVLENVASFVTYSSGLPFQQLIGCLLTLPYMLRAQVPSSILPCSPVIPTVFLAAPFPSIVCFLPSCCLVSRRFSRPPCMLTIPSIVTVSFFS
jgi:hypothetical protein